MIKAIIPTRDYKKVNRELVTFLSDANIEMICPENKSSIWEAFSAGYKYIGKNDLVILCHDDIIFYTDPKKVVKFLQDELSRMKTGFVGVAGTKKLRKSGVWWEGLQDVVMKKHLSGQVFHPPAQDYKLSYYGPYGPVEVMDGLFLACRGSLLGEIGLDKPSWLPEGSDWDFYDIFLTYTATKLGYENRTIPIQILHDSVGIPRDSWNNARNAFIERFKLE